MEPWFRSSSAAASDPVWSLDVERPDVDVVALLLRGSRDPLGNGPAEDYQRDRLPPEAGFLQALQRFDWAR